MKTTTIYLFLVILIYSCNPAKKYLNEAIDIMEEYSIKRDSIDWKSLRTTSIKKIGNKKNTKEFYPIIKSALKSLDDNHSFLMTPNMQKRVYRTKKNCQQ